MGIRKLPLVAIALMALTLMTPVTARAQAPVDSLADLWSRVRSGRTIYVTDASARETKGVLVKVTDTALTMLVDGKETEIPALSVRQVEKRGDSLRNGFLIGAAIGGASAAAALANCDTECRGSDDKLDAGFFVAVIAAEFGGIGALIDYAIPGRTVVYRAPTGVKLRIAPMLLARSRGLQFSISF